jgi:hypothetical protein
MLLYHVAPYHIIQTVSTNINADTDIASTLDDFTRPRALVILSHPDLLM